MGELLRTLNERGTASRRCADDAGGARRPDCARRQGNDQQLGREGRVREDVRVGPVGRRIVARKGSRRIGDEGALLAIVADVIAANADAVAQYRAGKQQTFGFLVGQVMKASGGKAESQELAQSDPAQARRLNALKRTPN